jgi:hypothetical protein
MVGHLDDLCGEQALDVRGARPGVLEIGLLADQGESNVRVHTRSRVSRRNTNRRPAIAAHGVDGNVKQRRHR